MGACTSSQCRANSSADASSFFRSQMWTRYMTEPPVGAGRAIVLRDESGLGARWRRGRRLAAGRPGARGVRWWLAAGRLAVAGLPSGDAEQQVRKPVEIPEQFVADGAARVAEGHGPAL